MLTLVWGLFPKEIYTLLQEDAVDPSHSKDSLTVLQWDDTHWRAQNIFHLL